MIREITCKSTKELILVLKVKDGKVIESSRDPDFWQGVIIHHPMITIGQILRFTREGQFGYSTWPVFSNIEVRQS